MNNEKANTNSLNEIGKPFQKACESRHYKSKSTFKQSWGFPDSVILLFGIWLSVAIV
jgi:hypothetical protein